MKRYIGLIVSVIALAALMITAYVFYNKYSKQMVIDPPSPGMQFPGLAEEMDDNRGAKDDEPSRQNTSDDGQTQQQPGSEQDRQKTDSDGQSQKGSTDDAKIMAPDFTLKDLDGNEVSLTDYRGKIVILNFWAVWCQYCVEEMPDFDELDKELQEAGDAVILAVNVQEPYDTVRSFVDESDISLKVLLDEDGYAANSLYGVRGYPTTFIVNSDGSLYTYLMGKADIETMRTVIDMARNNEPIR
jgi:peroxiredoxin